MPNTYIPAFSSLEIGKTALRVSQLGINVTGQNITNQNVKGYTRQRLDMVSLAYGGKNVQYSVYGSQQKAGGVGVDGISQIRDPYLDIRFRESIDTVGRYEVMDGIYGNLEDMMTDFSINDMNTVINQFKNSLQTYSDNTQMKEVAGVVVEAAKTVTQYFNQYAHAIDEVEKLEIDTLTSPTMLSLNTKLTQIADLNQQIREFETFGAEALELIDARNVLIDDVAKHANIEIVERTVDIGSGDTVTELDIRLRELDAKTGKPIYLVSDRYAAQFEVNGDVPGAVSADTILTNGMQITLANSPIPGTDGTVEPAPIHIFDSATPNDTPIKDGILSGYFKTIYSQGTFDPASDIRGLAYYRKNLDTFAQGFAKAFNDVNQSVASGIELFVSTTSNDSTDITAGTIKINDAWLDNPFELVTTTNSTPGDSPTGATDVLIQHIKVFTDKISFNGTDIDNNTVNIYSGYITEYMTDFGSKLGIDKEKTHTLLTSAEFNANAISNAISSVSGVSQDEETVNLMTFQKGYAAASKVITVLDEMLDTLINRTGVVGR